MERNKELYHYTAMPDRDFPVDVFRRKFRGQCVIFGEHWHEHLQFFLFSKGNALIRSGGKEYELREGDAFIINCNELHYGESTGKFLDYHIVRIDTAFLLSSQPDLCQIKYLIPLINNRITFKNKVTGDRVILDALRTIIAEFNAKKSGYELEIKAKTYEILVRLLRAHVVSIATESATGKRVRDLTRLRPVFEYMNERYTEKLDLDRLAELTLLSKHHFCRLFKEVTGYAPGDYLNRTRIAKAADLLRGKGLSITETALAVGFDDPNYFRRLFRKYEKRTPSSLK